MLKKSRFMVVYMKEKTGFKKGLFESIFLRSEGGCI